MSLHPDAMGCNAYCVGDVHCTTVLTHRQTEAEVLADLRPPYAALGSEPLAARPCELTPAAWWAQHDAIYRWDGEGIVAVTHEARLATGTVWRVHVRMGSAAPAGAP